MHFSKMHFSKMHPTAAERARRTDGPSKQSCCSLASSKQLDGASPNMLADRSNSRWLTILNLLDCFSLLDVEKQR